MTTPDVIVVGSGPSGVNAAAKCAQRGKSVLVLDVGYDDERSRQAIPAGDFLTLRRHDAEQSRYFVGAHVSADELTGVRVGAQLTPPRQFITRNALELAPIRSTSFAAMQSLALGGLGAGWGAGTYSYNDLELDEVGLPVFDMLRSYDEVAADIGIAGPEDDDTSAELSRFRPLLPPHEPDTNAGAVFGAYHRSRDRVRSMGLTVGRAPSAVLSRRLERDGMVREANPYEDMDFYSDASRSVYRPRFTLDSLLRDPNVAYRRNAFVTSFRSTNDGIDVCFKDLENGTETTVAGRRLILAAGAIGTSRIALRSLGIFDRPVPVLSNAYTYLPCVNLAMLGRPAENRRHSLAQLCGVFADPNRPTDKIVLSFFSYRSLLMFKLIKEMPLPPNLGLLTARLLLSSLTIVGIHHPDRRADQKTMRLREDGAESSIDIVYKRERLERAWIDGTMRSIRRALRAMGCVALGAISPETGASIHYAGAFGITTDRGDALGTAASGQLHAAPAVYIGDSGNWRYLPAKGLTMTLMANARRVAAAVCDSL